MKEQLVFYIDTPDDIDILILITTHITGGYDYARHTNDH